MTQAIMLQGTASDVGKSVLVAGLCRIFYQDGRRTAPFKSQNMALNSGITADGKEMGRAQIFQAEAAGIEPDVRMNPVLLKPTSDLKAQVVLMGKVATDMDAVSYHEYKPRLREQILSVYRSLAQEYDVLVLEGAGSPAEINLRDRDIVNMGMAEMAQCPVILVADIDRGGVFAAIYGTLALLEEQELAQADLVILPGSKNTLGDLQWLHDCGMAAGLLQAHQQGIPLLGICGGYQMLGETIVDEGESGLGTQPGLGLLNTVTQFARHKTTTQVEATMANALPDWLAGASALRVRGYEIHMGKTTLNGSCRPLMQLEKQGELVADGAMTDDGLVFGTYLHGLFDSDDFTRALVNGLRRRKGLEALNATLHYAQYKSQQFDILADAMRQHIDIEKIYHIMQQHQEPSC